MYHMCTLIYIFIPRLLVMRMHNLHGTEKEQEDEESSDEESDEEEDQAKKPLMELAMLPHYGGINRVRVRYVQTHRKPWTLFVFLPFCLVKKMFVHGATLCPSLFSHMDLSGWCCCLFTDWWNSLLLFSNWHLIEQTLTFKNTIDDFSKKARNTNTIIFLLLFIKSHGDLNNQQFPL